MIRSEDSEIKELIGKWMATGHFKSVEELISHVVIHAPLPTVTEKGDVAG